LSEARRSAIDALLAKSNRTLEAARSVIEIGFFDDASSRAYYAAFHATSAALASRGLFFSSHGQVLGAFNREFVKPGLSPAEAFQKIRRLFEHRQVGDYSATVFIDRGTAEQDVADAAWLVDECRRLIEDY
jgi:uncharacterized protein (UPF0332 family)